MTLLSDTARDKSLTGYGLVFLSIVAFVSPRYKRLLEREEPMLEPRLLNMDDKLEAALGHATGEDSIVLWSREFSLGDRREIHAVLSRIDPRFGTEIVCTRCWEVSSGPWPAIDRRIRPQHFDGDLSDIPEGERYGIQTLHRPDSHDMAFAEAAGGGAMSVFWRQAFPETATYLALQQTREGRKIVIGHADGRDFKGEEVTATIGVQLPLKEFIKAARTGMDYEPPADQASPRP